MHTFRKSPTVASRPLSVVSINNSTGKIDGATIVEDWVSPKPLAYRGEHLAQEWWPVRAMFGELHSRFMLEEHAPLERGHMLRVLYFSGVHPSARGSGVIAGLWDAAVDAARSNGYTSITAQATSEATRKMLAGELGFTEVASVAFKDFTVPRGEGGDAYSGRVFKELEQRGPNERLSLHKRLIPSDLY